MRCGRDNKYVSSSQQHNGIQRKKEESKSNSTRTQYSIKSFWLCALGIQFRIFSQNAYRARFPIIIIASIIMSLGMGSNDSINWPGFFFLSSFI